MSLLEVFISELLSVDRLSTCSVSTGEVSSLDHEVGDDAVELGARVAEAVLTGGEGAEVLSRLGHVLAVEVEVDDALLAAVVDDEVHWGRHDGCSRR